MVTENVTTAPFLQVLYTSRSIGAVDDGQLLAILEISRRNNAKSDITGLLIARERRFLQLLEGPPDVVRALLKRLDDDDRHLDVRVLAEIEAEKRLFPAWSMGFVDPKLHPKTVAKIWPEVERAVEEGAGSIIAIVNALKEFNRP